MVPTENPVPVRFAQDKPARHSRMALAAVLLSIFAFIPPLGIAAVVLGHIERRRIRVCPGLNGGATALAALIIGYTQMFLVTLFALSSWQALRPILQDFRRDPMVQSVLRESDAKRTFDYDGARAQEATGRSLMVQMVAIEDEYHRDEGRGYLCNPGQLAARGLDGFTAAEKRAFGERLEQSAYVYEVRNCTTANGEPANSYRLTAVPRSPQMPEGSMVFCADETGMLKQLDGGTSDGCYNHGYLLVKPEESSAQKVPLKPELPPTQEGLDPCKSSEKIDCDCGEKCK